jgi:hypothetical protein
VRNAAPNSNADNESTTNASSDSNTPNDGGASINNDMHQL